MQRVKSASAKGYAYHTKYVGGTLSTAYVGNRMTMSPGWYTAFLDDDGVHHLNRHVCEQEAINFHKACENRYETTATFRNS